MVFILKTGQRYALTFLPGKGLEMALDGEVLGRVEELIMFVVKEQKNPSLLSTFKSN